MWTATVIQTSWRTINDYHLLECDAMYKPSCPYTAHSRYPSAQAVLAALSRAASPFHPPSLPRPTNTSHWSYLSTFSSVVPKGHVPLLLLFISGLPSRPVYNHVFNICLVQLAASFLLVWLIFFTLKMEAIHSCKASANSYQTTHHHIPKDHIPYFGACKK